MSSPVPAPGARLAAVAASTDAEVVGLLDRVPGWAGRARVTEVLGGGITNRNFLVHVHDERFVLRIPGNETELLSIDRDVEREANERAFVLGIAPEVTAFLEPEGCLVTRFVPGAALTAEQLATPERLGAICRAVRAFHESGPLSRSFDCFRVPEEHRATAAARGVRIHPAYERAAAYAAEIEAAFGATPEPRVPCHNDLNTANWIVDADRLWLLDWEYAGMNERFFDLGAMAANNDMSADAEAMLLVAYFGERTPRRAARLALMKVLSDLREAMWGQVQQAISVLDVDYQHYVDSHFDRLLRNASRPDFGRLLVDAALPEAPEMA
jgi:thiamine kinase-like enzyme